MWFEGIRKEQAMQQHDPKFLRSLAASYRARTKTEPYQANVFLEIADDMERHAFLIESQEKAHPVVVQLPTALPPSPG